MFTFFNQYKWPIGITSSLVLLGTCCYHWRAKILSAYLSFTLGVPVRVQQCYFGKASLRFLDVKVIAEQDSSVIPSEALYIPELRIHIQQQRPSGNHRLLHLVLVKPQVNLIFQNMQMTDNNWRRLARLSKTKGHLKSGSKQGPSIQLGRVFLEKGATLSVQSFPLQQKLMEDINLQEMYLDREEFRSFDGFVGFLERISAKNILEGNTLTMPPAVRQALKDYASDVVKQRWNSTKDKLNEKVDKWSKKLEETTKSFDEIWQHHSNTWKVNMISYIF
ncbi:uncharacterized protein Gasu_31880 [Galdieria sulphuraria]|uniref:Uncharacterized protein n=1 Tax=Galdieria sulphuraria TaxID=130081 RepID=M2Y0M5_GALSU|nr:uncharacterized protein Gasu_31880 [Galdieria sulphuraria]EME29359.1 hypothetical protein Gasu_31880 [Galdieria sulphuraria]|eukprot:XP_005705879.1 hypothetical protein Gasu_31880 [Galdieria sulphuraria]